MRFSLIEVNREPRRRWGCGGCLLAWLLVAAFGLLLWAGVALAGVGR